MISASRHGLAVAFGSVLLASCGGGGGGGSGGGGSNPASTLRATFNTDAITFSAQAPFDVIELQKNVTGTVTQTGTATASGTLYVIVEVPANSFFTVPEARIDTVDSGHATVRVPSPDTVGAGSLEGSFRIRLCLNSQTCASGSEIQGSPHTVSVRYTVGDVLDTDTVTPRTVLANTPGSVILRGRGFTASTTVSFGGTAATSVTYVNPTQLRVQYPPLAAGTHAVALDAGATAFTGSLVSVPATNYGYAWIPHPSDPFFTNAAVYDAERGSFVYAGGGNGQYHLLRYEYSGGNWVQAADRQDEIFITQLRMSHDGSRILALQHQDDGSTRLLDLDPTTLASMRETPLASTTWSMALANDGNYVFGNKFPGTGGYISPDLFGSTTRRTAIRVNRVTYESMEAVASGDGSKVVVFGNGMTGVYDPARFMWSSVQSNGLQSVWNYPRSGSADHAGTRFAALGVVVDQNMLPIGQTPPSSNGLFNAILSADGSRLYVYDQGDVSGGVPTGRLRTFDVNTATTLPPTTGANHRILAETIAPIVLANNPNGISTTSSLAGLALTPDGRTIIICGISGCVVQPTPP